MTRTIRRTTMATLLALGLALGACGGGSDDTGDDAGGDSAEESDTGANDGNDDNETAGDQPAGGADQGDTDDGDTTIITVDDVPGISEECEAIANFIGATGQLLSGQVDPTEGRAILDDFLASVDDSIRADAEVMAGATAALLDVIEEFGGVEAAFGSPEGLQAVAATSTPEYMAATERMTDYLAAACEFG